MNSEDSSPTTTFSYDTVVIGAGQAGLATGYHLAREGRDFVILEAHGRVGDVWRNRYDSLRLYSPARYDGLPGMAVPGGWRAPTKDELADYLEAYAEHFALPVETGVRVTRLSKGALGYRVTAEGCVYEARNVVIASGTWKDPKVPDFASELDSSIRQLHSHDYRNPAQLQPGPVLVVGAAHSGADVALDVSGDHETIMAGRVHGELPFDMEGPIARVMLPIMWFAANRVLTEKTPIGRKVQAEVRQGGGPLLRVKLPHLAAAGVEHVEQRVTGVENGRPVLADGRVLDVANVVWCTGFRHNLSWIDFEIAVGDDSWPAQTRGVQHDSPGLYWVGLPFLYSFSSTLVGGVGRDAERVAKHIASRPVATPELVERGERIGL